MPNNHTPGFMIVIKGNEASEHYASYCAPSWEKAGINITRFDAVTPTSLKRHKDLTFARYSQNSKYRRLGIKAEITKTEKAAWYSHFELWKMCCYLNKPIIIMEHDSYLEAPENIWFDPQYEIIFYDKAAMGSYLITPVGAKRLVHAAIETVISSGPFGFVINVYKHLDKTISVKNPNFKAVTGKHPKYKAASNQVMSKKYGNTIEHYCNLYPHLWPKEAFHKFIEID